MSKEIGELGGGVEDTAPVGTHKVPLQQADRTTVFTSLANILKFVLLTNGGIIGRVTNNIVELTGTATQYLKGGAAVDFGDLDISDDTTPTLGGDLNADSKEINNVDSMTVDEGGESGTPAANKVNLYAKADGLLYSKDDAGAELLVSSGSGGSQINSGLYANLPAAGNAGNVYLPTDSQYELYDNGVSWDAFYQGLKMTIPVNGDFAWVNQGSATVDDSHGSILLSAPGGVGNSRMRVQNVPSTPYTITASFLFNIYLSASAGLGWLESGSGKNVLNAYAENTQLSLVQKYSTPTTWNSNYIVVAQSYFGLQHFRIEDDGVNRKSYRSVDGFTWQLIHSVGRTDFITPDQVFFYARVNTTAGVDCQLMSWLEE